MDSIGINYNLERNLLVLTQTELQNPSLPWWDRSVLYSNYFHSVKLMYNVALRNLIAFILCCQSIWMYSQNLVPNGNFEKHTTFDFSVGPGFHIQSISDWESSGTSSLKAYCHRDFVRKFGQQRLKESGFINFDTLILRNSDAMVKLYYGENCPVQDTGCATYLKAKLLSPLELGDVYEVSMWVYAKESPGTDTMVYSHIGMFLTRDELFWKTENRISTEYFSVRGLYLANGLKSNGIYEHCVHWRTLR